MEELEKREALERVLIRNYLDLNRAEKADNTDDIMLLASAWLEHIGHIPNTYTLYQGKELHLLERLYFTFIRKAKRPYPLTVVDLCNAWEDLQREWENEAIYSEFRRSPVADRQREFELAPLVLKPLPEEEIARREELCRQSREALGLPPAGAYVPEPVKVPRLYDVTANDSFAIGGTVTGVVSRLQPPPGVAPVPGAFKARETASECAHRLGFSLKKLGGEVRGHFAEFNKAWQEEKGLPVERADIEEHFENFIAAQQNKQGERDNGNGTDNDGTDAGQGAHGFADASSDAPPVGS